MWVLPESQNYIKKHRVHAIGFPDSHDDSAQPSKHRFRGIGRIYPGSHRSLCLSRNQYGKGGQGFLRVNIACPRQMVREGMKRLIQGVLDYESWMLGAVKYIQ